MSAIPLLGGVVGTSEAEFIETLPVNLEALIVDSNIAKGQFRAAAGAVDFTTGPGTDRGGIVWNGTHYRVMGTKLVTVSSMGVVTELGDVGGEGPVTLDYSFDRLAINSGADLFYWTGASLIQVTDIDLGRVLDMMWIDGYFMTTDGTNVVVTQLSDPTAVDPLKYGSAEDDPDMCTGLIKFREEAYVLGVHTIQVFRNVGGNGFPFATIEGATIPFGCVSATAKCLFGSSFAFVGSARNESLGVYIAGNGDAQKISTRLIDDLLEKETNPAGIVLESVRSKDEERLYVHLEGLTLVFLLKASEVAGELVWYQAQSGIGQQYRIRYPVEVGGRYIVGDTNSAKLGVLDYGVSTHFGELAQWQFETGMLYNESLGAIIHQLELVGLPGRQPFAASSSIFLSLTTDGQFWGQERALSLGASGARNRRLAWRPHVRFGNYLGLRFRGYGPGLAGFARLEGTFEALGA